MIIDVSPGEIEAYEIAHDTSRLSQKAAQGNKQTMGPLMTLTGKSASFVRTPEY